MSIASVVVEIRSGSGQNVLAHLALMPTISVYGMTENQIVTVVEGSGPVAVEGVLKEVQMLDDVLGVYPVFINEDE